MNKYYSILDKILSSGKLQENRKGTIKYLLNEQLALTPADLLDIFEGHNIARKKLKTELELFMQGERSVEKYRNVGLLRFCIGKQLSYISGEVTSTDR